MNMKTMDDERFLNAFRTFVGAAMAMERFWPKGDAEPFYTKEIDYLPSFDEFVCDLMDFYHDYCKKQGLGHVPKIKDILCPSCEDYHGYDLEKCSNCGTWVPSCCLVMGVCNDCPLPKTV